MSPLLSMDGTRAIGFLLPLQECNGLVDCFLTNVRGYLQQFVAEEVSFCKGEVGAIKTLGFLFHDCLREVGRVVFIYPGSHYHCNSFAILGQGFRFIGNTESGKSLLLDILQKMLVARKDNF